jgi:hypothetical protein
VSVPPAYLGLWRRQGIWRADGSSASMTPTANMAQRENSSST